MIEKFQDLENGLECSNSKVSHLGKRTRKLENDLTELQDTLQEQKDMLSDSTFLEIMSKSYDLPREV